MKKVMTTITILIIGLWGCKKTSLNASEDPTLKNMMLGRQTIPPKNMDTVGVFEFSTGSLEEPFITNAKFSLVSTGVVNTTTHLKNLFFTIANENGAVFYQSEIKTSVGNQNIFSFLGRSLDTKKKYMFCFFANVQQGASDGSGDEDALVPTLELAYVYKNMNTPLVLKQTGGKVVFTTTPPVVNSTLELLPDPLLPKEQTIVEQEQKVALSFLLKSTNDTTTILEQWYNIEGPGAKVVSSLKLYDSTTNSFIMEAPVVGAKALFVGLNIQVLKDQTKRLVVVAKIGDVWSDISSLSFKVVRDKVKYQTSSTEVKTEETDLVGNSVFPFKSVFTIKHILLPTILANGRLELYRYEIIGQTGHKQFTFEILLNDLGVNDTLTAKDFDFHENGNSVKSRLRFTDVNGVVDTLFTESDTRLFITYVQGDGESTVSGTKRYSLFATVNGFNDPNKTDAIAVRLLGDHTILPESFKFVNNGGLFLSNSRIFSSAAPNPSAVVSNFLFSDKSAGSQHSAVFNLSSNDWANSALFFTALPWQFFYQ